MLLFAGQAMLAQTPASGSAWRDVNAAEYQKHLEQLGQLVADCQKQRTADVCDTNKIGADDRVQWTAGGATTQREIRYDWLRFALDRAAGKKDNQVSIGVPNRGTKAQPVDAGALLTAAHERLAVDWREAGGAAGAATDHTAARRSLTAILARPEYQGVTQVSARERFLEWLENLLENILARLVRFGTRSPWIAIALRALLVGVVCLALVWALIRIERRSRVRIAPEFQAPAGSPAAREWQLWLADARAMAARRQWRDAIHFLYWATISRLESKRLWPADRARTPREYLRLMPAADHRTQVLTSLTRSFERTWYGGREARDTDFDAALKLAAELGVE